MALAVADHLGQHSIETRCATSTGKTKDTLAQRFERQTKLTKEILNFTRGVDLVVIEGLFSSGQVGGSQIDRCGLWWRVSGALLYDGAQIVVVAPTSAKKFMTGAGNADKGSMVRAAGKLWPSWEPSTSSKSEDEADAVALASVGLALLGRAPFEMPKFREDTVAKLQSQMDREL